MVISLCIVCKCLSSLSDQCGFLGPSLLPHHCHPESQPALTTDLPISMVLQYTPSQLLDLRPASRTPIALATIRVLRGLNLCVTSPTHRGCKAGKHKHSHRVSMGSRTGLLNAALLNVRSVNNKATLISEYIMNNNLDILLLTETWLRDSDQTTL